MEYIIINTKDITEQMNVVRICVDELSAFVEAEGLVGFESYTKYSEAELENFKKTLQWTYIETDGLTFKTRRELIQYHVQMHLDEESQNN